MAIENESKSEGLVRYFVFFNKFAEAELNKIFFIMKGDSTRGKGEGGRERDKRTYPFTFPVQKELATITLSTLTDSLSVMYSKAIN